LKFIMQTAQLEAERSLEQECVIRLSARDSAAFVEALDHPMPPNEKLTAALQDYVARRDDQTGALAWAPRPMHV
jgi:uncharacterized protein (DUF1778 family)